MMTRIAAILSVLDALDVQDSLSDLRFFLANGFHRHGSPEQRQLAAGIARTHKPSPMARTNHLNQRRDAVGKFSV